MKALEFGSLLHDIGKIGVPDSILRKPANLTEEEWVRMREHPIHGQQILRGIKFLEGAARVVAQHHEKWDGSGYPLGLASEDIDICARIFSVADAFDAITSDRVYRQGRSYEEAAVELDQWSGRQFDPKVVEAFHRVPQEDWAELRRRSLMPKTAGADWDSITGTSVESQLNAPAS
jgi:HD-GYP domain-containing protein (c-di-GMP phosphodiesterase class II)